MFTVRPNVIEFRDYLMGETLLTLRAKYPKFFYPQTWYDYEDFANVSLVPGTFTFAIQGGATVSGTRPPAIACAVAALGLYLVKDRVLFPWEYVLTSDEDLYGNAVYVGGWHQNQPLGFQIHRLLKPRLTTIEWSFTS